MSAPPEPAAKDEAVQSAADAPTTASPPAPEAVLRRSSRRSKPSARAEPCHEQTESEISVARLNIRATSPRRNPKRKASETAKNTAQLPERPLEDALSPLQQRDIDEWEGWIELESEPAFFNVILKDLGVENVKAQEVFSIDHDSLNLLPKPVHGFIFLYQYLPEEDEVQEEAAADHVWFANQTTPNACATVALLNIAMNANIRLGTRLQAFKDSTKDLCTALRGHRLSTDPYIRTVHNSFARRMNQLNTDLFLENEAQDSAKAQAKKRAAPKKSRQRQRKTQAVQYGFHFVAYVQANQSVWELDGLKSKPHLVGTLPAGDGDWVTIVQPRIQARMLQYEGTQLSFNLLALCQSPLTAYSRSIAESVAGLRYLYKRMASDGTFNDLVVAEHTTLHLEDETQLSEFGITNSDVSCATIPENLKSKLADPGINTEKAYELFQQLVVDAKSAMGEYRAEIFAIQEEEGRVKARKKDYGPALHKWVQKLAEKGVLEEVIKTSM